MRRIIAIGGVCPRFVDVSNIFGYRCGNVASILELDENLRQEYKVFNHAPSVRRCRPVYFQLTPYRTHGLFQQNDPLQNISSSTLQLVAGGQKAFSSVMSSSSTVSVFVVSPDIHSERRYDLHTTIAQLKVTRLDLRQSLKHTERILRLGQA